MVTIRTRVGQGFDIHRFVEGPSDRVLILGGVQFPDERPLAGHSDADVIAHAVADALLGGSRIGRHRNALPRHRPTMGRSTFADAS